jgi:hypothetical protein
MKAPDALDARTADIPLNDDPAPVIDNVGDYSAANLQSRWFKKP